MNNRSIRFRIGFFIVFCTLMIAISIYFIVANPKVSTCNLSYVDIQQKQLVDLVSCKNCTIEQARLVDEYDHDVTDRKVNKEYTLVIVTNTYGLKHRLYYPITFSDYSAPILSLVKPITVKFQEDLKLSDYILCLDNVDKQCSVSLISTFDNTKVGLQNISVKACDRCENCTIKQFNVIVEEPICKDDAYFNGTTCVCRSGYIGNGLVACIPMLGGDGNDV